MKKSLYSCAGQAIRATKRMNTAELASTDAIVFTGIVA
jgi:hypothetical protein